MCLFHFKKENVGTLRHNYVKGSEKVSFSFTFPLQEHVIATITPEKVMATLV